MNILNDILEQKNNILQKRKREYPISALKDMECFSRRTVSLRASIRTAKPFAVITELKQESPSAGKLRSLSNVTTIATDLAMNGAAGLSVLTEEHFFSGTVLHVHEVRRVTQKPILRKDFIFDAYQVYEAKAYGADAILLILGILTHSQVDELRQCSTELGIETLLEIHQPSDLDYPRLEAFDIVGINNRNLQTLEVDVNRSIEMVKYLPDPVTKISESGLHSVEDVTLIRDAGFHGALIGEYFMRSPNPGLALRTLLAQLKP